MRRARILAVTPALVLLLLVSDRVAYQAMEHQREHGVDFLEDASRQPHYWFPALRGFLFHLWTLRIHAAKRTGSMSRALRHAREALAIVPDIPLARIQLANMLAWDLAAREADSRRSLAWMAEGLAILDEGLRRDPYDARLHNFRGILIQNRGDFYPEFEEAFRATHGRSTLEEGTEALVRAAELGRGTTSFMRQATKLLAARGEDYLDRGLTQVKPALIDKAAADFRKLIDLLERLLRYSGRRREPLIDDLDYARASLELCELLSRAAKGEAVSEERVMELEAQRGR